MTSNLRWLYERFRTAPKHALSVPKGKPGEWMELHASTPEARFVGEAAGNMPVESTSALLLALKQLEGGVSLNALVGVTSDMEVRLGHFRNGTSKTIYVRFFLAAPGKKQGARGTSRDQFPPSFSNVQTELFDQETGATSPESVSSSGGVRRTESTVETENRPDGLHLTNSHYSDVEPVYLDAEKAPDGHIVPPFEQLIEVEDFERFLADGGAEEDSEIGRFVKEAVEEARAMIQADETPDFAEIARSMRATLDLAQGPAAIVDMEAPEPQDWHNAVGQVGDSIVSICQKYRSQKGKLAILCPSPAAGKTRSMVEAARADRAAGKRVGYAVLSRGLIEEAKERLTGGEQRLVQLHVIEGRHAGNCVEFESVEQAAALGYAPGTQVCPRCDKYPSLYNPFSSLDRNLTCEYYGSRLRALREIAHANRYQNTLVHPYPLILTTHAGMAIGTAMHARGQKTFRSQPSLWQFDTIFIDEDPTGALEQTLEIKEEQLVYEWKDSVSRRPDAHTQMTRVLRSMFTLARAEREVSWTNGFRDDIHTRDHGSTYASNDLIGLLQRSARLLGYDLEEVLAQVENESSVKSPKRGELLSMRSEVAAEKYPHRFLVTISQAIRGEINTRKNAPEGGAGLDLAYRVHADLTLTPDSDLQTSGTTVGAISLTVVTPFTAPESNVIIGDAYASVEHYEALFKRYRLYDDVDIVNHRVQWPRSSLLIRIPTRCTSGDFPTDASFIEHCDQAVLPLLGMEEGRRVLIYTHKASRELLEDWLKEKAQDIGIEECAVEHWGSGRGKDIYRDFDTFIAATEYLPNIYGLVHEANMRMAQSNPMTPRIYFWNAGEKRKAGGNLTEAITGGDPTLANAFQRRAIDELAQAVHRIRPAKPRPCEWCGKLLGKDPRVCAVCKADQPYMRWQKRCWILGYHVPMSAELLAATSTAVLDKEAMELKRDGLDHFGRGARVKVHADLGLLSFVSDREIATAMGDVFRSVGCWSPAFCHVLMGVPLGDAMSRVLGRASEPSEGVAHGQPFGEHLSIGSTISSGSKIASKPFSEPHRLTDRIYTPTAAWKKDAVKIPQLPMYRSARQLFIDAVSKGSRPPETWHVKRDWMPKTSPGYECIGDPRRLEAIIDYYGPNPPKVPF